MVGAKEVEIWSYELYAVEKYYEVTLVKSDAPNKFGW